MSKKRSKANEKTRQEATDDYVELLLAAHKGMYKEYEKARHDLGQLKAYLRQETIPWLESAIEGSKGNEETIINLARRGKVWAVSKEIQEIIKCLKLKILDLEW